MRFPAYPRNMLRGLKVVAILDDRLDTGAQRPPNRKGNKTMNPVVTSPHVVTAHLAAHIGQTDEELIETVKRTGSYLNHVWSLETGSVEFLIADEQGEPVYFFPELCRENNCQTCDREITPLLAA